MQEAASKKCSWSRHPVPLICSQFQLLAAAAATSTTATSFQILSSEYHPPALSPHPFSVVDPFRHIQLFSLLALQVFRSFRHPSKRRPVPFNFLFDSISSITIIITIIVNQQNHHYPPFLSSFLSLWIPQFLAGRTFSIFEQQSIFATTSYALYEYEGVLLLLAKKPKAKRSVFPS